MKRWVTVMAAGLLAASPIAGQEAEAETSAPVDRSPAAEPAPPGDAPPPAEAPAAEPAEAETPAAETAPPAETPPAEAPAAEPAEAETPAAEATAPVVPDPAAVPPPDPAAVPPPQAAAALPLPAGQAGMGFFRLRRTLEAAATACREGRHAAARDAYLQVLAATRPGQKRRLDALQGLAVADLLAPEPALDEARAALAELTAHDRGEGRQQAQVLAVLLDRIAAAHVTAAAERRRLEERLQSEWGAVQAQLEADLQAAGEAGEAQAGEMARLAERLAAARREIARLEDELARSERAVERLKKALVEGVGRP